MVYSAYYLINIKSAYHDFAVSWSDTALVSPKRILNVAQVYRILGETGIKGA